MEELTDNDLQRIIEPKGRLLFRYTNIFGIRIYVTAHKEVQTNERHSKIEYYINFYGFYKHNPQFDHNRKQITLTYGITDQFASLNGLKDKVLILQYLVEYGSIEFRKMLNNFNDYNNHDDTIIISLQNLQPSGITKNDRLIMPSFPEDDKRLLEIAQKHFCQAFLDNFGQHHLLSLDLVDICFVPRHILNIAEKRLFSDKYMSDKDFGILTEEGQRLYARIANRSEIQTITGENLVDYINNGENSHLEFKASLRWDYKNDKFNTDLEFEIIKTIAAFSNSSGGNLLIGVSNSNEILGLGKDYSTFSSKAGNRDTFELHLMELMIRNFGQRVTNEIATINFIHANGMEICNVIVSESNEPIFVKKNNDEILFIRMGNSSRKVLSPSEIAKYCISRFQ